MFVEKRYWLQVVHRRFGVQCGKSAVELSALLLGGRTQRHQRFGGQQCECDPGPTIFVPAGVTGGETALQRDEHDRLDAHRQAKGVQKAGEHAQCESDCTLLLHCTLHCTLLLLHCTLHVVADGLVVISDCGRQVQQVQQSEQRGQVVLHLEGGLKLSIVKLTKRNCQVKKNCKVKNS